MADKVTNEQIYEILREFKTETRRSFDEVHRKFGEVERRFGEVDRKFGEVDRKFDGIHQELLEAKQERKELRQDLEKVNQRVSQVEANVQDIRTVDIPQVKDGIDKVKITWSNRTVAGILGTSAVTSAVVTFLVMNII